MKAETKPLLAAFRDRKSLYSLVPKSHLSNNRIEQLVKHTLLHTPSPFNTQGARVLLLLGDAHRKFWEMAIEEVKATVPVEAHPGYLPGIEGYMQGYGTAVFWDDPAPLAVFAQRIPLIANLLPQWTEHSQGMHHYALWTALEAEGLGANLQHFSMLEKRAQEEFNVPKEWKIKAQLVFGTSTAGRKRERTYEEVEGHRMFVHGADSTKK